MAESYNNPPPSGSHHPPPAPGDSDNEPRIDGDGQEVNALRFLGAGGPGPNPPPPAPSITPSQSSLSGGVGVSQPLQPSPQNPPAPPQTPHNHLPPSIPQTPGGVSAVYDPYSDPSGAAGGGGHHPHHSHGMQVPPGPASNPYPHGMMPGAPMMMMPGYPYGMYANPYGFMPPAYPPIPPQPFQPQQNSQTQLAAASAMMNKLRVDHPTVYRKWYDKYMLHKRDPDRIPCPPLPQVAGFPPLGGLVSSQTLPNYHGRSRKKSTRSSINGDLSFSRSMRPNDSFADYNSLPTHPVPNSSRNSRRPNSTRASVDGDTRSVAGGLPDDDFEIDGPPNSMSVDVSNSSMANHVGNNSMLHSTFHGHNTGYDRSGRSSRADGYRLPPGDIYGGEGGGMEHESLNRFDSSNMYGGDFKSISQMEQREPSPVRRMTPMKFSTFHCIAAMSPLGHMIRIKSSGTVLELVKMKQFVSHLPEYREMESFPGPLTQISTHKNTVIQFCKRKIKEARSNPAQLDRENYILLWEFLMLMLRQNGMVVGSDIAELLLNAVEQQKQLVQQQKQVEAQSKEERDFVEGSDGGDSNSAPLTDKEEGEGESSGGEDSVPITHPPYNPNPPPVSLAKDEQKLVEEFCSHLLYGHKKDALDFAMDHGLWGHALFFASKMDERSYGHVLARFANGIPLSSPLQTLYHIMCGKQPASVTSCGEGDDAQGATFGDWKPHLAMLLSNSGYKPEVEHRAILTLGDTLQQRNHVFAAQFCYLMGHEEFSKESRLGMLLGYSPQGKNKLEATQMTEVYEFARKLADPNFNLGVSFQQSKLEYAKTLVSYGFVEEALAYCEEITKVLRQSGRYGEQEREELIKLSGNTLKIAERIAVADESGTASGTWVEELRRLAMEPTLYAAGELEDSLRKLSLQSSSNNQGEQGQGQGQQQFDQLSYSSSSAGGNNQQQAGSNVGDGASGSSNAGASIPTMYDPNYGQQQQPQGDASMMGRQYSGESVGMETQQQVDGQGMQQPSQMTQDNSWGQSQGQGQQSMMNGGLHLTQQQQQYEPPPIPMISQGQQGGYGMPQDNGGYQQQQQQPPQQGMMDGGYSSGPQSYGGDNKASQPTINNNHWYNPYDSQPQLGGGIGQQPDYSGKDSIQSHQNSSPVKTEPRPPAPSSNASSSGKRDAAKDKSAKDKGLGAAQQQEKGWFSGLFTRLKPKNQMILPDDKNPTIVWDDQQKRWINTAADGEDDTAPAGPPPKDSELLGGPKGPPPPMQMGGGGMPNGPMQQQQQQHQQQLGGMMMPPQQQQQQQPQGMMMMSQPNNGGYQQPQPQQQQQNPSQGMGMMTNNGQQQQQPQPMNNNNNSLNKYKLQRNRGMKGYVDVFNPNASSGGGGGASSPPPPVPVLTPNGGSGGAPVPNLFIPPPVPQGGQGGDSGPVSFLTAAPVMDDSVPGGQGQQGQDGSLGQAVPPPMFNPAQFQGYSQGQ